MTLNIGFIGVGGIAQEHLNNVSKSDFARVTAVCDIQENAAAASAAKYGARPYTDYAQMLDQNVLDAVFVCVPPFAHAGLEKDIIDRNIALFVEKPVGLDMASVTETANFIHAKGIINGTGYCLRYWSIVQQAKEYLADKRIALVVGYYCTKFVATPWWRELEKSGGQLVEQTTHIVDLIRYLGGEVDSVHAYMNLVSSQHIENLDIPDVGVVNLRFGNGALGHVHTTFLQPDHRSGVEILGEGFRVTVDGGVLTIVEKEQTVIKHASDNFYETQDRAFLEAVRTGNQSLVLAPYDEGARTLAVTLAANESATTLKPVQLPVLPRPIAW